MGGKKASKAAANEAAQARADEEARQARIKGGTDAINRIFYGGTETKQGSQVARGAAYDPNAQYFLADGSTYAPKSLPGANAGQPMMTMNEYLGSREDNDSVKQDINTFGAKQAYERYANQFNTANTDFGTMAAQGKLFTSLPSSTTTKGQFDDSFFNSIADNYTNFALPQLQEQHTKAGDELIYDLARTGNLDSSTRATKGADLQKAYDLNKQSIADKALSLKNDTKNAVEDARFNVISQLNATGDADGAANAALTRASALSQPSMDFSPLSGLFADFTSGLGNAYAQERAYAASGGASHGGASYGNAATGRKGTVSVRG